MAFLEEGGYFDVPIQVKNLQIVCLWQHYRPGIITVLEKMP